MKKIFLGLTGFFSAISAVAQFSCTGLVTTNATYTGIRQTFTVPAGVIQVRVSITGGSGGVASGVANTAGGGATVWTYITVVPGDIFRILIGQKGGDGDFEAAGGGSSAVYKNGTLIMVAGGGGGEDNTGNGGNGVTANNGTNGAPTSGATACPTDHLNDALAGTGGGGGNPGEFCVANTNGGGGGGGLNSAGSFKAGVGGLNTGGGQGNINGVNGGAAGTSTLGAGDQVGAPGGWGWSGGGGGDHRESGGGGGYSGGGGAPEGGNPGGGGSFIATGFGITTSGSSIGTSTTTGSNGSGIICATAAISLPVSLESFSAERITAGVLVKWSVSQEINTAHFIVEKSTDGYQFVSLQQINGAGNTNGIQQYSLTDNAVITGNVYYRLKIVDNDGKFSYSAIRYIKNQQQQGIDIYPNPVANLFTIVLPAEWKNSNTLLQIINTGGQVVFQKNIMTPQADIDVSLLSRGFYLLKATNDKLNAIITGRFIK